MGKIKTIKTVRFYLKKPINFSIAAGGPHIKTDNFEITIYFCSFSILQNVTYHFYKMLGGCHVFYFYFYFVPVPRFSMKKVRKPINKK